MTTRRDMLKLGAVSALGLAGFKGGDHDITPAPAGTAAPLTGSLLSARNTPVPYAGVFRRPPELLPFEKGYDGGDPSRPYERYALTQKLGQAQFVPGLMTTLAGYNGIFPGPTIRATQGTRIEVRIRNALPAPRLLQPGAFPERVLGPRRLLPAVRPLRTGAAAAGRIRRAPHALGCPL